MVDLWPNEIEESGPLPPVTILKEQASLLGKKTKNLVEAQVYLINGADFPVDSPLFEHGFFLIAPVLQNYRYRLFSIEHGVDMYPIEFQVGHEIKKEISPSWRNQKGEIKASSEEEFQNVLQEVFQSEKTLRVIKALLTQSKAYEPFPNGS